MLAFVCPEILAHLRVIQNLYYYFLVLPLCGYKIIPMELPVVLQRKLQRQKVNYINCINKYMKY